jgi:hypothetical protein
MKSIFRLSIAMVVFFCSCGGDNSHDGTSSMKATLKTPEDSLFHQVMEGHDAGMAKIGRLKKYSRQLETTIDSISKNPKADKSQLSSLRRVKDSLDTANASMFIWMDGFKADTLSGMGAQRMQYLEMQKASVTIVRNRIDNSLRLYDSLKKTN